MRLQEVKGKARKKAQQRKTCLAVKQGKDQQNSNLEKFYDK